MPPGVSSVTPTRPWHSAVRARVKPTTPNFDAQYAVASPTARWPSVEATVTTRPRLRSSSGSASRTTAAVPSRFTPTMRSHVSRSTASSAPGPSVPAPHTTASSRPSCPIPRRAASDAAELSARSASIVSWSRHGRRSIETTDAPTLDRWRHSASPSPDDPPVTSTDQVEGSAHIRRSVPRSRSFEDPRGGAALQVGHRDDRATPLRHHRRLGQLRRRVVAALHEHLRPQAAQRLHGRVVVEGHDLVDTGQGAEHRRPVLLPLHRPARPLEPPDRPVAVEQHHEPVTEPPGTSQRRDVARVEQIEAPAGGDEHRAVGFRGEARGPTRGDERRGLPHG